MPERHLDHVEPVFLMLVHLWFVQARRSEFVYQSGPMCRRSPLSFIARIVVDADSSLLQVV